MTSATCGGMKSIIFRMKSVSVGLFGTEFGMFGHRYGEDLAPIWGSGNKDSVATRLLSGGGKSGVGDIIEFASGIFAYNWRAVTGPGAFNDPDFLVVGCPTDRPCEGYSQKGQTPLTDIEQRTYSGECALHEIPLFAPDVGLCVLTSCAPRSRYAIFHVVHPAGSADHWLGPASCLRHRSGHAQQQGRDCDQSGPGGDPPEGGGEDQHLTGSELHK